ncbi:hypothetical protein VT84_03715 [Gemmata sp. SH-PL17]|uniref:exosortase-associated EpsI family protein n=1 Tax=Gemmata sp. SH-PL17 TaxID=1630693 RepID=UPI00078D1291|nr:exosortase-associated EpsI family protein [Gemmata sp. SH-PL17]AMV23491.1 hypothetical protein VT84_03715 [Gemmata sp. SH-PL17]
MSIHPHQIAPALSPGNAGRAVLRKWLVIVLAVAGLAGAAIVEGTRSNRWGPSEDVRAASEKLTGIPTNFGNWTSSEYQMSDKVLKVAEATGHLSRIYKHRKTGAEFSVLILCGPSGPIGAHTPEACYAGSGYTMAGEPQKKAVALPDQSPATYWSARFDKMAPPAESQRVCWMWGLGGDWEASTNVRFGWQSALYKMYVTRPGPDATSAHDPIHEFLTDFLPEVKKALAPRPSESK